MELQRVIEEYVASRRSASAISTRAAAQTISMVLPLSQILTKREFEDMLAKAAITRRLAVHFDAVELPKQSVSAFA